MKGAQGDGWAMRGGGELTLVSQHEVDLAPRGLVDVSKFPVDSHYELPGALFPSYA